MRSPLLLACALVLPLSGSIRATENPTPVASSPVLRAGDGAATMKADLKGARELHLVVTDAGDGLNSDWADWGEPYLIKADGTKTKLTDVPWISAKSGWKEPALQKNINGDALVIKDAPVAFGVGTHAPSLISYALPEGVVGIETKVGIDHGGSAQGNKASVVFQLYTQKPAASIFEPAKEAEPSHGLAAAQAAVAQLITAEGLAATLFASEPQVVNPTNIDIDPRGRVWATEAANYRTTLKKYGVLRPEGDRVVILEDADGDGVAEKETTFWQAPELKAPLGICVLPQTKGTKVIVSAAPNVWLLTDADGDDKAEKAEKLFTVGGAWDHDHQVHAFSFGMDGKFYFNMGNEARKLMDPEGKVIVDIAGNPVEATGKPYRQGMVFRCDIDLEKAVASHVETLGSNFRNNYEVAVDSFGTLWQSDNDDDGNKGVRINYVMQYGNYGYTDEMTGAGWRTPRTNIEKEVPKMHWHQNDPGTIPNLLQTGGGSPTGILVNEGALLGERFRNQIIHCDAGPRVVRAYPVTRDGAGYQAETVDILTSKDNWYRPSDVAIAPDGALFVADWYDGVVGGHNMTDDKLSSMRGRIYRVAPTGSKSNVKAPDLATEEGALAALRSPNRATQYVAWQALHQRWSAATGSGPVLKMDTDPRMRARILGVLANTPHWVEALKTALVDPEADVRIAGIRLAALLSKDPNFDSQKLQEVPGLEMSLIQDKSPQVRREIALALHGGKQIGPIWSKLALQHDGQDRWYLEALGIGAAGDEDGCFEAWLAAMGGEGGSWNAPAGRDILWRSRSAKAAPLLAKLLSGPDLAEAEAPRFLRSFDFLPAGGEKTKALIQLATLGDKKKMVATEALQRLKGMNLESAPELKAAVLKMTEGARGTAQFVELVRDFKLPNQGEGLLEIATGKPDSLEAVDAAKLLLSPTYAPVVKTALAGPKAAALLRALGNTVEAQVLPLLKETLLDAQREPALRQQAVQSLVQSPAGVELLLTLAREGKFPEELRLTTASALARVQLPKQKDAIAQLFPMPNAMGGQALPPLGQLALLPGQAEKGKALFAKQETTCITCHRIGQQGVDFGPALSEIGSKLPKEALFEAIIAPNAGVSMGFETTVLTLKDGNSAVGIVRSETEDELILALPGGIQVRHKKGDITKREKQPTSMMPSGLNQALSQQDLVDLVAYLSSLKAPGQ